MTRSNLSREEARTRARLIHDVAYAVALDLTGEETFESDTTIRFRCSEPGAETFLDLVAPAVTSIELNGSAVPLHAFDGNRIRLTGLAAENTARVVADCAYHRTELGMHRFVDPVDGRVYLHTDFEPFDAHRVFACFDQPDLKATFEWSALVPTGWEVISNMSPARRPDRLGEHERWTFPATKPIPTYVSALVAGEWHAVRDRHRDIDLGLFCRASLAGHLDADEILEITRAGLDFFEPAFAYPYPFGKYDQVFVPESNSGAMENAACVTVNDMYIFRSRVTDAARERRADTILHEMAHMWFGDLVTMRWWNDLWLNESFASFMAVLSQVSATRFSEGWTTFANTEKTWAYRQDQLPTTHPIVADIPDVESIHLNFDGITYAKGASVLKQLVAWVGQERFLDGMKRYMDRHQYGNAELADFLASLEETSSRDLHAWSTEWLQTAGVNTFRPSFSTEGDGGPERFASFFVRQEAHPDRPTLRRHRLAVGLYDLGAETLRLRRRVELDVAGEVTSVPELAGEPVPDLVLLNDHDLTYGKTRLDDRSLRTVIQHLGDMDDSLARAVAWTSCWDMTRDGEMAARDYLRLVLGNVDRESRIGVLQNLLGQASTAVQVYGDPTNRDAALRTLAEGALRQLERAEPGSDHQLVWARAFVAAAADEEHLAFARGLLDGSVSFDGLVVDTELRWHIVHALAAAGAIGGEEIDEELRRDPTDRGARHAGGALASRPTPEAKEAAWRIVIEDGREPLAKIEEIMDGFQRFGQQDLLEPYAERFFDALADVWERRDLPESIAFARRLYPHVVVSEETVERTDRYLDGDAVPPPIRRLLLEGRDGILRAIRARATDAAAARAD